MEELVLQKYMCIMNFGNVTFRITCKSSFNCIQVDALGSTGITVLNRLQEIARKVIKDSMNNLEMCAFVCHGGTYIPVCPIQQTPYNGSIELTDMEGIKQSPIHIEPVVTAFPWLAATAQQQNTEQPDIFLSYRWNDIDSVFTAALYDRFTDYVVEDRMVNIFLDTKKIGLAELVREKFFKSLVKATVMVPICTTRALEKMMNHSPQEVDNVLVEWLSALVFMNMSGNPQILLKCICPLAFKDESGVASFSLLQSLPRIGATETQNVVKGLFNKAGISLPAEQIEFIQNSTVRSIVDGIFGSLAMTSAILENPNDQSSVLSQCVSCVMDVLSKARTPLNSHPTRRGSVMTTTEVTPAASMGTPGTKSSALDPITPQPHQPTPLQPVTPQQQQQLFTPQPQQPSTPQPQQPSTPQPQQPFTPQPHQPFTPQPQQPFTLQPQQPFTPQPQQPFTPQQQQPFTPQPQQPFAPQPQQPSTPQPQQPSTPQPQQPFTPQQQQPFTPQPQQPFTPHPHQPSTPQPQQPFTPQPQQQRQQQPTQSLTPQSQQQPPQQPLTPQPQQYQPPPLQPRTPQVQQPHQPHQQPSQQVHQINAHQGHHGSPLQQPQQPMYPEHQPQPRYPESPASTTVPVAVAVPVETPVPSRKPSQFVHSFTSQVLSSSSNEEVHPIDLSSASIDLLLSDGLEDHIDEFKRHKINVELLLNCELENVNTLKQSFGPKLASQLTLFDSPARANMLVARMRSLKETKQMALSTGSMEN